MRDVYKHISILGIIYFLTSCDAADPSFLIEEVDANQTRSQGEALPESSGQSANKSNDGSNQAAAFGDDKIEVIKDNGKPASEGGTVPDRLLGEDQKSIDKKLINAQTSITESINDISDGSLTISPNKIYQEEILTHRKRIQRKSTTVDQIVRSRKNNSVSQGYSPSDMTQTFNQNESGILDILIVIDDSGSMDKEQQLVAANLPALLTYIKDSDWRIAVVTTYNGRLTGIISKGDTDTERKFSEAIAVGASGRGNEKGIQYAREGLDIKMADGTSWIRPDSSLAILIISDEDNCSDQGKGCGSQPYAETDYLTDYISTFRPASNPVRVHGLFWHPSETQTECPTGYFKGIQYAQVVASTGGKWGSICSTDYSAVLSDISSNLNMQLKSQFNLSFSPIQGTFSLTVRDANGQPLSLAYTRNDTTITFTDEVPYNAVIEAKYKYGGSEIKNKFPVTHRPALETLEVTWTDQSDPATPVTTIKNANSYDIISETNAGVEQYYVVFKDGHTPPEKAVVEFSYREYGTLISELTMSCDYELNLDAAKVKLSVGDPAVELSSSSYVVNFNNKKVVISPNAVPTDGQMMTLSYDCYSRVLDYEYSGATSAENILVYRESTKEQINVTLENNMIRFPLDSFALGEKFLVRNLIDFKAALKGNITPLHTPLLGSIVVTTNGGVCDSSLVKFVSGKIDLSECGYEKLQGDLVITYKYISEIHLTFKIDEKFFEQEHRTQIWKVWVDGVVTTDYSITANKVVLDEKLATPSVKEVKVEVTLVNEN